MDFVSHSRRDFETEIHQVIRLSKRATVFLSCASADRATADALRRVLRRHDFTVTSPEDSGASAQPIQDVIGTAINEAVERGFVLALLSPPGCGGVAAKQRPSFPFPMAAAALAREAARWRLPGLACASFCRMAFFRLRIPLKTSPRFGVI
ncbi:MAG TPA: toll/interleukin-1 receptor domain-containing protein [Prosthecobacter sp.]|nr:toll/interleukin-1 receptor domain-containing protein [Prosthecobacter sp.]HRK13571.1 toll/interleukin-1 receptor domain-containing protein [Prosthecobacter sp.]